MMYTQSPCKCDCSTSAARTDCTIVSLVQCMSVNVSAGADNRDTGKVLEPDQPSTYTLYRNELT